MQKWKLTPIVGRNVPPLENTLGTCQILWQLKEGNCSLKIYENIDNLVLCFKNSVARSWKITRPNSIALFQEVPEQKLLALVSKHGGEPVKASLGGRFSRVVVWTEAELKVTHVVCSQLDPDLQEFSLVCLHPKQFNWKTRVLVWLTENDTLMDWIW